MHQLNVVHNDLKCNNILIGDGGDDKITDFGLSCTQNVAEMKVGTKLMGAVQ
jgi:serine/threonine protein kinase